MLNPISPIDRFLLKTRYIRIVGRRLVPRYGVALPDGMRLLVRTSSETDEEVVEEIYAQRIYEKYRPIGKGMTVFDIGANIGVFTLKAAGLVGREGRVIALEPGGGNFRMLRSNLALNSLDNVTARRVAVGRQPGRGVLKVYQRQGANSLFTRSGKQIGVEDVAVDTLDNVVREENARPDLLKVDVEGSELDVLEGGKETLAKFHPTIVMEAHKFGPSTGDLSGFLSRFEYDVRLEDYKKEVKLLYAS